MDHIAVDVEGNGAQPPEVVELAIVNVSTLGRVQEVKEWIFKPEKSISFFATKVHGITNSDVADKPKIQESTEEIASSIKGRVFVAHNAGVDFKCIKRAVDIQPGFVLDTLKLARKVVPGLKSYKLVKLVDEFGLSVKEDGNFKEHRAAYDAMLCSNLFLVLCQKAKEQGWTDEKIIDVSKLVIEEKTPKDEEEQQQGLF